MKKLLPVLAFTTYLLSASPAFAALDLCPSADTSGFNALCGLTGDKFGDVIGAFITLLFVIAVVVALVFLVWGGVRWILSGGDKSNVESARNTIVAAIVGLVIVFLSYFILNIVLKFFEIDISNLEIPSAFK